MAVWETEALEAYAHSRNLVAGRLGSWKALRQVFICNHPALTKLNPATEALGRVRLTDHFVGAMTVCGPNSTGANRAIGDGSVHARAAGMSPQALRISR